MFPSFTKSLLPLLILAMTYGCGKNINEAKVSSSRSQIHNPELSTGLTLEVDESVSSVKTFVLPRNAWFTLPSKLIVKNGNAVGKKIKIYYNLLSSADYEFQCTYQSIDQANVMDFVKCESKDGYEIITSSDDLDDKQFPMDKGASVKLQLTNPSGTGVKVESVYVVEWK